MTERYQQAEAAYEAARAGEFRARMVCNQAYDAYRAAMGQLAAAQVELRAALAAEPRVKGQFLRHLESI